MCTYIIPFKLRKFKRNIPDTCIKCEQEKGTLFDYMCDCEEITEFWKEISHAIYNMLYINLILYINCSYIYPIDPIFQNKKKAPINICLLHAKRLIALSWKNVNRPHLGQRLGEMSSYLSM